MPKCAIKMMMISDIEMVKTRIGPTFMPSLESAKKRIRPAPAAGIGPSDWRFRFDLGIQSLPSNLYGILKS